MSEDPVGFPYSPVRVRVVLEDLRAEHDVEARIVERQSLPGGEDVGRGREPDVYAHVPLASTLENGRVRLLPASKVENPKCVPH